MSENESEKREKAEAVGNAAAMREALELVLRFLQWMYAQEGESAVISRVKIADEIDRVISALSAPARNQEVLAAPIDLNERSIHIGDSVHMLNTRDDGDHEWDDVVLSLEYVGKSGGDDWLVYGEDGAAWACECEVLERKGESDGR